MTTLAVLCDYREEGWPSMQLCAEMLIRGLERAPEEGLVPCRVAPPFRHRFARLAPGRRVPLLRNADRLVNRMWDYPRALAGAAARFDLFHVADHSYAHLVHALPPRRTGVYCHDLDAFRCVLAPELEPRPAWFRAMARRILAGLRAAAVVFYSTAAVRRQIETARLVPPERLVPAPLGVSPEFGPAGEERGGALPRPVRRPYLLHVGSCIPRKRIDLLLDAWAAARAIRGELQLVQVGGDFTAPQREHLSRLGLQHAVVQLRDVPGAALAELYRRATLVLQPSDAEGFGLPVAEALACGAPVLASDLAVLREVGGNAALYAPPGDRQAWAETTAAVVSDRLAPPPRDLRLEQARRFRWEAHVRAVAAAYRALGDAGHRRARTGTP